MQIETDYTLDDKEVREAIRQYLNNKADIPYQLMAGVYIAKHQNDEIVARVRLVSQEVQ